MAGVEGSELEQLCVRIETQLTRQARHFSSLRHRLGCTNEALLAALAVLTRARRVIRRGAEPAYYSLPTPDEEREYASRPPVRRPAKRARGDVSQTVRDLVLARLTTGASYDATELLHYCRDRQPDCLSVHVVEQLALLQAERRVVELVLLSKRRYRLAVP